jgi:HAD superfamily hydrolase (TIGR01490 family)
VKNVIAFFDFDGTVTTKDSLLEFIKYSKGSPAFYFGFALHVPILIAYKLNIISNHRAKEIMLKHFFGKMSVQEFKEKCVAFTRDIVPSLIRPKALKEINKLKDAGAEVVIVSASPEYWLNHWCSSLDLEYIATRLDVKEDRITGKIDGRNCHGKEKVRRINEKYDLDTFSSVYCYGDTRGDIYMLSLADYRFYKPFR